MSNCAEFALFHSSKVDEIIETKSGGIIFTTTSRETFAVLDDDLASALNDRIIPGIDHIQKLTLQPTSKALEVLNYAKETNQFIHVFAATLFGMKLYRLECSCVPGYAKYAYEDSERTEKEREAILKITLFIEENPEFKAQARGRYIAIVNEKVVEMFFGSIADIFKTLKSNDKWCFFRVSDDYNIEKSQRL